MRCCIKLVHVKSIRAVMLLKLQVGPGFQVQFVGPVEQFIESPFPIIEMGVIGSLA